MAKSLNVTTDLFDPIEVTLWDGSKYSLNEPTRRVERKMNEALDVLVDLPDDSSDDDTFNAICEVVDVLLEPIPVEDGKKVRAKTQLKSLYKAEKIGIGHVETLLERLRDMRAERPI